MRFQFNYLLVPYKVYLKQSEESEFKFQYGENVCHLNLKIESLIYLL